MRKLLTSRTVQWVLTCLLIIAVTILLQSTEGILKILILIGGVVSIFLSFVVVLSNEPQPRNP